MSKGKEKDLKGVGVRKGVGMCRRSCGGWGDRKGGKGRGIGCRRCCFRLGCCIRGEFLVKARKFIEAKLLNLGGCCLNDCLRIDC